MQSNLKHTVFSIQVALQATFYPKRYQSKGVGRKVATGEAGGLTTYPGLYRERVLKGVQRTFYGRVRVRANEGGRGLKTGVWKR